MAENSIHYPDMSGQGVLVTGGASGIGAALVEGFVAVGAKVAFIDVADEEGHRLAARLSENSPHPVHYLNADLRDVAGTQGAVDKAAELLGSLSILVNNAGWDDRHEFDDVTEDYWDNSQAINLKQVFFVSQAAVPHLRKSGGGAIVNFSSIAYLLNMGAMPAYTTAKAGIIGLTKSLAGKLGPDNIRVNAILPGMIVTERQKELWLTEDGIAAMVARQCLKRVLVAEDLIGPCLFLASRASAAMTAQTIIVDGGAL